MKPSTKAISLRMLIVKVSGISGANRTDGKALHPRLIFIIFVSVFQQIMHITEVYQSLNNVVNLCKCLAIYSLVIQLAVRLLSRIIRDDEKQVLCLQSFVNEFYEREEKVASFQEILSSSLEISEFVIKFYLITLFIVFNIPIITSLFVSWYTNDFILFMPFYLPYINPKTLLGFSLNTVFQTFVTEMVYILFMGGDTFCIYFTTQTTAIVDIYGLKLKIFGEKLEKIQQKLEHVDTNSIEASTSTYTSITHRSEQLRKYEDSIVKVECRLIELIKEFHEYNEYIQNILNYVEFTTFVAISSNAVAIGMSMFVLRFTSVLIGASFVLALFFQVFFPCVQGTLISYQNEKLLQKVCEFPWYELSKSKQKIFLQFIHAVQNTNKFTIPIIGDLNMELFTDVMKAAYSYFMVIWNFTQS